MKKTLQLLLFLFLFTTISGAQSFHYIGTGRHHIGKKGQKINMPKFDKRAMMKEDSINEIYKVGGMRFAKSFDVDLTPENSGELTSFDDSTKIWKIDLASDSAYSINLIFSKFHLLTGDTVYIYNADTSRIVGPLTEKNNLKANILPTVPIDGSKITVEFHQSALNSSLRGLQIGSVNHDYRGFRGLPYPNEDTNSKDTCSIPASCVPEVKQVKQSVCLLILNGNILCSGTLINNTAQDGKPYLLTAAHCFNETTSFTVADQIASTIVAFFNYEVPNCTPSIRGSMEFTIGSTTLKAFAADIDFALVELSSVPPVDFRPYYAGWNLSTSPTAPFRGIHQPFGKVKVVARDDNAITNFTVSGLLSDSHWLVAKWTVGTTQPGSSGSGLFDSSLRLIGALTGGDSECANPIHDYYYRLNKAWNFYSDPTKQLKAWLDPTSSGVTTLNGINPYGKDSCSRFSNFSLSDLPEKAYLSSPASGLVAGQNSYFINEYGEKFSLTENAFLYGVYLMPCIANANASRTSPNVITIKVYAGDVATVPDPSYFLDEKIIDLKTLQWSSTNNFFTSNKGKLTNNENYIKFDSPIATGKKFFITYDVPYTNLPTDSFSIFTALGRPAGGLETAFAYNGSSWVNMFDITGKRTSLWIDPVIRYDSTAIAVDTSLVERSSKTVIFPNPAKNVVYVMTRNDKEGDCIITLYSPLGQKISTTSGKVHYTNIPIDIQGLPQGVYLLRVAYSDKTETHKLIVL